jgi:DNA-binding NarL/FixJ family response regulator
VVFRTLWSDMTIRIALADDHAAFRSCLKALLEQQPDFSVVIEADSGRRVIDAIQALGGADLPEVLVLDIEMPDLNGLQAAQQILGLHPQARILILSWYDDLPFLQAAEAAGSLGHMLKDDPWPELVHAVREVAAGRPYVSAALRRAQTSGAPNSAFC